MCILVSYKFCFTQSLTGATSDFSKTAQCMKLHKMQIPLIRHMGLFIAQVVSPQPSTAVQSQVSPCGLYGGQYGTGTVFSLKSLVFPCQYHFFNTP
jgi:hypothetical protein